MFALLSGVFATVGAHLHTIIGVCVLLVIQSN
jgi:hypothetical protein